MDIMSLLGHTTLQMTSRYSHAMPENLRTAVDSLTRAPAVSSGSGSEPPSRSGYCPGAREARWLTPEARQDLRQLATGTEGM